MPARAGDLTLGQWPAVTGTSPRPGPPWQSLSTDGMSVNGTENGSSIDSPKGSIFEPSS
jgi:hypothetical protein